MNVNGVTSGVSAYSNYTSAPKADAAKAEEAKASQAEQGVIYEPSNQAVEDSAKKTYTPNTELINKLKADADERTSQLRSLVEKLITGQGNAIGNSDDIWSFLRTGNFTVDAETKAQAQKDIAEDGYWGVEQTSSRILDFAKALSGGDPSKIEKLRDALRKALNRQQRHGALLFLIYLRGPMMPP